jgi:hypothetical protein
VPELLIVVGIVAGLGVWSLAVAAVRWWDGATWVEWL